MYSAMSSIPSGGPPGGTHTQELWYSLRGIDARLESVLSTDKCLCDACCARSQPLILLFLFSYFGLKNFLYGQAPFCTDVSVFANTFFYAIRGEKCIFFNEKCIELREDKKNVSN